MPTHPQVQLACQKAQKTFRKIIEVTLDIVFVAGQAEREQSEKKRDKAMVKIMELTEKIERLYSTQWH